MAWFSSASCCCPPSSTGPLGYVLLFIAAAFGAANVVGGYLVTDRMLGMFRRRPIAEAGRGADRAVTDGVDTAVRLASLGGAVCFVLGLHLMNSPATARRGNQVSAFGMARRARRGVRRGSARRNDVGGPLARAARRDSGRQRGRPVLGPHGSHDVDAATGQPVQRGRWRSCRPYRHRRLRSRPASVRRHGDGNRSGCADRRHHVLRLAARRGQVAGVLERLDLAAGWPAGLSRAVPRRRRIGHRRHRRRRRACRSC